MRFKYVCSDCGKEYITDKIMYQCPDCSKLNDGKSFPKGNLIVKLDKEVLKKAKEKEHVTPNDFYPYPSDDEEAYHTLTEAYQALNESVTIEIQTTDSTVGVLSAIDGTVDIGMASRNLKDDELSQINHKAIAIDGIVVVVNNDNPLTNVSSEDLKEIYLGNIKTWETLISE